MENHNTNCPICDKEKQASLRYPNSVCNDCFSLASDKDGNKLAFYNESISGGFAGTNLTTNEPYNSNECFINGVECVAQEARFGGIVIQKKV